MKRTVKNIKRGESYFFADTNFDYSNLFKTYISKEKINKIIDGEFSTRNDGDRYEVVRVYGFDTEEEAKNYLIKRIKERMKNIKKEAEEAIKTLITPTHLI